MVLHSSPSTTTSSCLISSILPHLSHVSLPLLAWLIVRLVFKEQWGESFLLFHLLSVTLWASVDTLVLQKDHGSNVKGTNHTPNWHQQFCIHIEDIGGIRGIGNIVCIHNLHHLWHLYHYTQGGSGIQERHMVYIFAFKVTTPPPPLPLLPNQVVIYPFWEDKSTATPL